MDKRGLKTSLVVSIVSMTVLCFYLIYYVVFSTNNYFNDDKIMVNRSNDANILLLERYVDAFNNNCTDMKVYYDDETLIKDVNENVKVTTILNLNNNYNANYLKEQYKLVFNEDVDLKKATGTCPKISYNDGNISKINCDCKIENGIRTHFVKAIKTDNTVKLYYKVAFITSKKQLGNNLKVFSKDPKANEIIDSRLISGEYKEIDYQKYLDDNYNYFNTYIYTFKIDKDKHYFHSIKLQ